MSERTGVINSRGKPLTLTGNEVKIGDSAPDCVARDNDMKPVKISDFKGNVVILSFVSSLDTKTCDVETRRFNQEAASLDENIKIVTVSMDLPFAQKRWCAAAGVEQVVTLSDFKERCLAEHYGTMIKEVGLHARAVFVLDKEGIVRYIQFVPDVSTEPEYEPVLSVAKELV